MLYLQLGGTLISRPYQLNGYYTLISRPYQLNGSYILLCTIILYCNHTLEFHGSFVALHYESPQLSSCAKTARVPAITVRISCHSLPQLLARHLYESNFLLHQDTTHISIHVQSCLSKPLKPEEQNTAELCRTQLSSTIICSCRAQRVPGNAGLHVLSLRRERRDSRTIPECVLRGRNALGAFEPHLTWQDITRVNPVAPVIQ